MDNPSDLKALLQELRRLHSRLIEQFAWIGVADDELRRRQPSGSPMSWHVKDSLIHDICDTEAVFWDVARDFEAVWTSNVNSRAKNHQRIAARAGELMESVAGMQIAKFINR